MYLIKGGLALGSSDWQAKARYLTQYLAEYDMLESFKAALFQQHLLDTCNHPPEVFFSRAVTSPKASMLAATWAGMQCRHLDTKSQGTNDAPEVAWACLHTPLLQQCHAHKCSTCTCTCSPHKLVINYAVREVHMQSVQQVSSSRPYQTCCACFLLACKLKPSHCCRMRRPAAKSMSARQLQLELTCSHTCQPACHAAALI